jgi:murein DD-endopeptidase MepM/ murein hydrolase activator NlpD
LRRWPAIALTFAAASAALGAPAPAGARTATEPGEPPPAIGPLEVFPVAGDVAFGSAAAHFGGGRGHRGQDVFAGCGTPVLAVSGGRVVDSKWEGAAGNYAVIATGDGRAHVYMHLRAPARPAIGDSVVAGDRIGAVGDTGDAWDCHLHFELWTAPGWYRGGHAIDPLPYLRGLPRP